MKIQGPNHSNFNPYQKQIQKQAEIKKQVMKNDQLQISSEAKQLQENGKIDGSRMQHVEQIKQAVDNGTYDINPKKTAEKILDFFKN